MTSLRSFIVSVRRRWFMLVAMNAVGRALTLAALVAGAALLVEYILAPEGTPLVILATAAIAVSAALAALVAWRMPPRWGVAWKHSTLTTRSPSSAPSCCSPCWRTWRKTVRAD